MRLIRRMLIPVFCLVALASTSARAAEAQKIKLEVAGVQYEVQLYDNMTARALAMALPQKLKMTRWGNGEYFGELSSPIAVDRNQRQKYEPGEVALWPDGNAFCILFDRTPASKGDAPELAGPGVPIGKIVGDISALRKMGPQISINLTN